ncbi:hypothetical protein EU537_08130 [Candidatus Thorarchaeota archaeon]|nr:MAG: hypothetical protein EU537_08130 [Candidatus Thorarchaeota archaeon]
MRTPSKAKAEREIGLREKRGTGGFKSVTESFIRLSEEKLITCPRCGNAIDFQSGIDWHGPTSFSCSACNKLLHMSYVTRQLEKMGLLDTIFLQ